MANSKVDRNSQYMKDNWGTVQLITDYVTEPKVIQEVMYDSEVSMSKIKRQDLFEMSENENEFEYGIEPTYKVDKNQKVLRG
jgi:hypothetical protein